MSDNPIREALRRKQGGSKRTFLRAFEKTRRGSSDEKLVSFYMKKKPIVLLRELASFLTDSVDLPSLLRETANAIKNVTKAEGVTLYMVDMAANEIYQVKRKGRHDTYRWKIEENSIVAAFVAFKKEYVMTEDVEQDVRFTAATPHKKGKFIKAVLCVPVVTPDGDLIALIELYRKHTDEPFGKDDLKITIVVTGWMGAAIHQNQQRCALKKQQELNEYLLNLTKCYFSDTVPIEKMITEVIKFAKSTVNAERGCFYIVDKENDELVADLFDQGIQDDEFHKKSTKIRFAKERRLAGLVAQTGLTINIPDVNNDPRFNKEIDVKGGVVTKCILCMPIIGAEGILGVLQVNNKKDGGVFVEADENLFKTFSVYCALALHYTKVQSQMKKTVHASNVTLNTLFTQLKPCVHDVIDFENNADCEIPEDFALFSYYIDLDSFARMPQYLFHMVASVVNMDDVNVETLQKFILSVRKGYRNITYHNFEHAFNVCHCMHAILRRNINIFSELECKALIIAALCHDLDHGGFTNNFLQIINDDLSQLYDASFLENHHFRVAMFIMGQYEIYKGLSEADYKFLHKEMKDAILATDLAMYFRFRMKLAQICNDTGLDWNNPSHRVLGKAIMITSCDLSGNCKKYSVAKRMTDNLYFEFYNQGDKEKEMGLQPLSIMDREQTHTIWEDQVQFLQIVVIPCVDLLRLILPNTVDLYSQATKLREAWQELIRNRNKST